MSVTASPSPRPLDPDEVTDVGAGGPRPVAAGPGEVAGPSRPDAGRPGPPHRVARRRGGQHRRTRPRRRGARHRRDTQPLRTAAVALAVVAVVAGSVVLVRTAWRRIADDRGQAQEGAAVTVRYLPDTPTALLALTDGQRQLRGLVLLAQRPGGLGGAIVQVPSDAVLCRRGLTSPLDAEWPQDGARALGVRVESMLGITLAGTAELDPPTLAEVLAPLAPVRFDNPSAVLEPVAAGEAAAVLFDDGALLLSAERAAQFLTVRGRGETEAVRLQRTEALWAALAGAGAGRASAAPPGASPAASQDTTAPDTTAPGPAGALAPFVAALRAGPSEATTLLARPAGGEADCPAGADLDEGRMRYDLARAMPGAVAPAGEGPRVWLVDATGDPELARTVTGVLTFVNVPVVVVSDGTASPAASTVDYTDPDRRAAAEFVRDRVLRTGVVVELPAEEAVEGVDLVVTLGDDVRQRLAAERAAAPARTTAPGRGATTTG